MGTIESETYQAVHAAMVAGDLGALKVALGNPPDFPNLQMPWDWACGEFVLEYAIYHGPVPFIRALLELGADPNYPASDGFTALIGLIGSDRQEKHEILELLLTFGADIQQRGVNDHTPLHEAVARDDPKSVEILLAHGADPNARTRIDHHATPLEEADHYGHRKAAEVLRLNRSSKGTQ